MAGNPALTPERILRRLEWRVIRRLDGRLQGDYRSLFRGTGIDVADLREYQAGDDLRHIDWNVTARMDEVYVREYIEDREVTGWLVLDRSASMAFGPVERRKHLVMAEVATTVAQILSRGGSRVGAILFDATVERTIPPGSGRNQVLRILHSLLQEPTPVGSDDGSRRSGRRFGRRKDRPDATRPDGARPDGSRPDDGRKDDGRRTSGTDLGPALRAALGIARRRSLVVVVSDFISEPGWERPLALLGRRHDVVCLQVVDRREFEIPAVGMIYVEDAETGEQIFVDTADAGFQRRLRELADQRQDALREVVGTAGVELHTVTTDEDLVRALARIADLRRRRRP